MTRHLVIGGAGGIGSSLASKLLERGESVVLAGRTLASLDAAAERLSERHGDGAKVSTRGLDARDFDAVEALVGGLAKEEEGLFGLACCAGSIVLKPAHLTSSSDFHEVLSTNLGTAFASVRAAGRHLSSGGAVVLFSSAAARFGLANHEAIAAAKAGIEALARTAAATYGARLRVNVVAPGLVDTPLAARITGHPRSLETSVAMHALGRIGTAAEVASLAAWLLGPDAGWVTGQVYGIDGGLGVARGRG